MIPSPFKSRSSLYGGLKLCIEKFSIRKLSSISASETIKTSILSLTYPERNSNLLLIQSIFKCAKTNFFKLLDCKARLQSVKLCSTFFLSELHSSTKKPALYSLRCQFKILDNSLILLGIQEPLLFK